MRLALRDPDSMTVRIAGDHGFELSRRRIAEFDDPGGHEDGMRTAETLRGFLRADPHKLGLPVDPITITS